MNNKERLEKLEEEKHQEMFEVKKRTFEAMQIKLTKSEALVLHELLYRLSGKAEYFEDIAEQYVLWGIECQLEKELAEPFADDYPEVLKQARETVKQNY